MTAKERVTNDIFYQAAAGDVEMVLIGNDFGSQQALMVDPDSLRRFVFPGTKKLIDQAHAHGIKVMHHSCGAIRNIIPDLIELGVDVIHPIQALATGMDPHSLRDDFADKVSFCGGVDAQNLLVNGTPEQVRPKVRELRGIFPTGLIISPSHEAILPDIPPANIAALFEMAQNMDNDKKRKVMNSQENNQRIINDQPTTPNIVYFFVDDMGYGDASCLNPEGRIKTPNIDRLAAEGMKFTDAHSTSAVCSPSRYSVLTGRYNWRSTLQKGIVGLYGDPLIAKNRLTVPGFLKQHGYHTACIGKWHLGQGWDFEADEDFRPKHGYDSSPDRDLEASETQRQCWREAFAKPITGGPTTRGFDYYFGVDVPNWPPYCFIENDRTVGTPSEYLPARLLGDNLASLQGPAMPYWHFEQLLPTWAKKADGYIAERAATDEPFLLYLPMTSPHTPLSVNKPFIGKSGLNNLYADLVIETDDVLGRVLAALEKHGVADNTLVIFASDNGCAHYIGAREDGNGHFESAMEPQGHFPSGPCRGYKSDAWDGGHRIPCIARWPGQIPPGSECDQLVCLSDLMATCAEIVGDTLPDNAGEDSVSMMPLFRGEDRPIREQLVHHSIDGKFAIRDGHWKLVLCPGSGGWTKNDAKAAAEGLPLVQLYDMQTDPGEQHNLQAEHPDKVREMVVRLKQIVADGRSTPGAAQQNDTEVDIWKLDTMPSVDSAALDDY